MGKIYALLDHSCGFSVSLLYINLKTIMKCFICYGSVLGFDKFHHHTARHYLIPKTYRIVSYIMHNEV